MTISNFQNPRDAPYLEWTSGSRQIRKQYRASVYAAELSNHDGIVVVEPDGAPHNAVIYNEDGSQRVRLSNPMVDAGAIAFSCPYYLNNELTVNSVIPGTEFGCVFDEAGKLRRVFETR
jgi:hypothetical protein